MFLQGLRIWILYDCRRTEQPANSDLCRRNATVRMNFYVLIFLRCCTWPSQKGLRWRLPVFSAFGRHLERHRGFPGERPQRHRPQRWAFRGSSRSCAVHYLLPAEQAHAHHASDKRGTVHQPAAQLPAGSLWPVSKHVTWRAGCWLCTFTSEVLTWVDAAWNVTVKIQTLFPF